MCTSAILLLLLLLKISEPIRCSFSHMCMSVNGVGATLPTADNDQETPAAKLRSYYDRVYAGCPGDPVQKMRDIAAEAVHLVEAGEGAHPLPWVRVYCETSKTM